MRYLVGLSGGVDSSVAIDLLRSQGHEVVAATLVMGTEPVAVPSHEALVRARETCRHLGVDHVVRDVSLAFDRLVVDPFCRTYLTGATPSPCILCNQRVKMAALVEMARELGCDRVATGHYARRVESACGTVRVARGRDRAKDQSYFLCLLAADQLAMVDFPLAGLEKARVRSRAADHGLPAAGVRDSQGVCFAPDGDYRALIAAREPQAFEEGVIEDGSGRVLGRHGGIAGYTVGQRKGLGLAGGPWYVQAIDGERRAVIVERGSHPKGRHARLGDVNLTVPPGLLAGRTWAVQTHHRAPAHGALVKPLADGGLALTLLDEGALMVPGQVAALYDGETVVGGGIIAPTL